jgi:hypothetical protein
LRGRHSRTLYCEHDLDALLDQPLRDAQLKCLPAGKLRAGYRDRAAFLALVVASTLVITTPFLLVAAALLLWS